MTKLEKRLANLRQAHRNINSSELIAILESLGFELRGGKGSHKLYRHPDLPEDPITVPLQRPLRPVYIKKAVNIINKLMERTENAGEND